MKSYLHKCIGEAVRPVGSEQDTPRAQAEHTRKQSKEQSPPPLPLPSRTNRTRLFPPPVLTGQASSLPPY